VPSELQLELVGEQVSILAEKALYWPREATLFVADVHLGKDSAMVASGIPVPLTASVETLSQLSSVMNLTHCQRLVILGDLWHHSLGRTPRIYSEFLAWRRRHIGIDVILVEGNHDIKSGRLTEEANVQEVPECFSLGPFSLCHFPQRCSNGFGLAGHIHPAVTLQGKGRQALTLPCLYIREDFAVLPAFGQFTGCGTVEPTGQDRVYVFADQQVLQVA